MQRAKIVRTQHPVGHGGFHTGHITTTELSVPRTTTDSPTGTFSYVYDCGSEQREAFNAELALYREQSGGSTDILFVSHLHADHINGIDQLQGMAPARKVVVPYLNEIDRLLFVLSDFEIGTASRSSLDYFADPVAWWFGRGVQQVIFLQPGDPNDIPPPRPVDPDLPLDDPRERRRVLRLEDSDKVKRPASRLNDYLKPPHGEDVDGLAPGSSYPEQKNALIAATGSYFQLEWRTFAYEAWHSANWILLPFVHPVDDPAGKRFVKDLRAALGTRRSGKANLKAALLSRLSSMEKVKELVSIYQRHFPGGHNAVSMSLYSGPIAQRAGSSSSFPDRPSIGWTSSIRHGQYAHSSWRDHGLGWFSTGDASLLQEKWRKPWREFYEPFGDCVTIMTLPHHGSAHNFHPEILEFAEVRYTLATTVEARNRVARMRETLGLVEGLGIRTQVVDDLRHSRFRVTCERDIP